MTVTIPKKLQATLWSASLNNLDLERDKTYIIHQIFSHGRMDDILWVLKTYPEKEIKEVFLHHPYKNYDPARFNFIKNYLLDLKKENLNESSYVQNTHRDIRQ